MWVLPLIAYFSLYGFGVWFCGCIGGSAGLSYVGLYLLLVLWGVCLRFGWVGVGLVWGLLTPVGVCSYWWICVAF